MPNKNDQPWLLVDPRSMPPVGEEVMGYNEQWRDPEYNAQGTSLCFWTKEDSDREPVWTIAKWVNSDAAWHAIYSPAPTHYMLKPIPPQ